MKTTKTLAISSLCCLLAGLILFFLHQNNYFRKTFILYKFDCGNSYSIVITAKKLSSRDYKLYSSIQKDKHLVPIVSDTFIDAFTFFGSNFWTFNFKKAIPMEMLKTKNGRYFVIVNRESPETIYLFYDSKNEQLYNLTQVDTKQFYALRKKVEKELPQTSKILQALKRLKQRSNEDNYLVLKIYLSGKFIQFSKNLNDSSIIMDFPVTNYVTESPEDIRVPLKID